MAYTFDVNNAPLQHGAACMFRVKTALKAAGWTVTKSSDGTTYNASGDQITHGESGAGGMDNNRAWFVLRQPGSNGRELCIQRDTSAALSGQYWRIKYSGGPSTGFVGGTPSATQVPSATDEQTVFSGGTDASPSFTQFLFGGSYTMRLNIVAGGAAEGYPFVFWATDVGYTVQGSHSVFALDMMLPGTYEPLDVDPAVVYAGAANSGQSFSVELFGGTQAKAWFNKDDSVNGAFQTIGLVTPYLNTTSVHTAGRPSISSGRDLLSHAEWVRNAASGHPGGRKGLSTLFRLLGAPRSYGTVFSLASADARDWVAVGGQSGCLVAVPWNGSKTAIGR